MECDDHYKGCYGKKKRFIFEHRNDIIQLRKMHSARRVSEIYCHAITLWDIYAYDDILKGKNISKKCTDNK